MKKNKFEFIIDSEFQSQIPALTDEEFQQLEENILSEGEVLSPLIVWGNILVDGHNRYKILQQHPEIPYTTRSISCTCETREDVLAWICKHQLGRRNLTPEQKKFLIGKQYHSEKSTRGGNHGNQYTQVANCQIDNLPPVENTTERIAKENNVSPSFVIRAEQFMKTVELMEKYCPGIREEILSGKLKLSQRKATIIRGTPTEALPTVISTWREEKLNGKPNDSADTYENSELLSKVTENNFSTAAISQCLSDGERVQAAQSRFLRAGQPDRTAFSLYPVHRQKVRRPCRHPAYLGETAKVRTEASTGHPGLHIQGRRKPIKTIEKILEQSVTSIPESTEDYYDEDGLLYCGKCHTPREAFFAKGIALMGKNKHPVECCCQRMEREKQEALINQQKHLDLVRRLKAEGFSDPAMLDWTFKNDNGRSPQMHHAHRYVEQWQTMRSENLGLLLWGGVGTGKSFLPGALRTL